MLTLLLDAWASKVSIQTMVFAGVQLPVCWGPHAGLQHPLKKSGNDGKKPCVTQPWAHQGGRLSGAH